VQDSESRSVDRRRFLGLAGVAAAAAGTAMVVPSIGDAHFLTKTVYYLDPEWGAGTPGCTGRHHPRNSCEACRACHAHDHHKVWTSWALANARRAHPNCKCLVKTHHVSNAIFVMIFGPPSGPKHRDEFDSRRDKLFLPWQVLKGVH
jgi:hypothetical protein